MATIASIVQNGKGEAGSERSWRVERDPFGDELVRELWHYSHLMLRWNKIDPSDESVLDYHIGWGSVSDQNGMNTAFRVLGLPLRYDRDERGGGPRITDVS